MNKPLKIIWSLRNTLHALYLRLFQKGNSGLLTHRDNGQDLPYLGIGQVKPRFKELTIINDTDWIFDQNGFNICVFASEIMGDSHQEKKKFSVKFAVKMAKRLGYISGNGFSYLKAVLKVVTKYGRLPYEFMPDEISGQSWNEYSKWDVTQEQLDIASNYKSKSYRRINNTEEAIDALEKGLALHTANSWYTGMNNPKAPDYYLEVSGFKIGGHAWSSTGYRRNHEYLKDYEMLNSYGKRYGNQGMARIEDLFNSNQHPVYIAEKLPEVVNPFNANLIQRLKAKGTDYILLVEDYGEYKRGLWKLTDSGLIKIEANEVPDKPRNDAFIIQSAKNGTLTPYLPTDFAKLII